MDATIYAIASSLLALIFAAWIVLGLRKQEDGNEKMVAISKAVREGANAYLKRQSMTIGIFAVILFIILSLAINWQTGVAFLVGAIFSGLAGYVGMKVSTMTNVKVTNAAKKGLEKAFQLSFRGGAVTGMFVVGLSLLGVSGFYYLFDIMFPATGTAAKVTYIVGFGFGASLVSLFARIGGGIFTKAADVGADLVGKVEAGIPEDDPRNPAVIADNVGDNVGDCAGMGADLFESYAVTAVAAMLLGAITLTDNPSLVLYPMLLGAAGIIASIIGVMFVRGVTETTIMKAMYKGLIIGYILAAIFFYVVSMYMLPGTLYTVNGRDVTYIDVFITALVGLAVAFAIVFITEYYTAKKYRPVQEIAKASQTGAGTNVISGLAVGLESTAAPTIVICAGIAVAYYFGGLYGVAIATMALLSVTGLIVAMDSYGPITDNAGGIAEMAGLEPEVRVVTDALDSVGNTTKAVTKGFAIGSAALAALALFASFTMEVNRVINDTVAHPGLLAKYGMTAGSAMTFDLGNPAIIIGLLIGGMLPFLFASFLMRAVGRAAFGVVNEVRRQFKEIAGIMEGTGKPDYAKCVDMVTRAALKEMSMPALMSVIAPLLVGFLLGPQALGGLLMGTIVGGLVLALMMATAGGAWDNAKKYIEDGNYGGKKSDAHKAAVVGDTVGDPTKDTAGPAINPLIKVVNMIALLFVELIVVTCLTLI